MITSTQNDRIKWLRLLQGHSRRSRQEGSIIVEGVRLAEEALNNGWKARLAIYTDQLSARGQVILEGFQSQGAQIETVSENVMRSVSDTQSPQGLLVALEMLELPLPPQPDLIFIPDLVRDPGNLGTMLRTAAAAGADSAIIPPATTDPFAPKALRAGMGAQFCLPIREMDWDSIGIYLKDLPVFLAAAGEGSPYTLVDFRSPLALIVGGEAEGAGEDARRLSSSCVQIPMPGGGESLNAAVAAGILLFEIVRQRRL